MVDYRRVTPAFSWWLGCKAVVISPRLENTRKPHTLLQIFLSKIARFRRTNNNNDKTDYFAVFLVVRLPCLYSWKRKRCKTWLRRYLSLPRCLNGKSRGRVTVWWVGCEGGGWGERSMSCTRGVALFASPCRNWAQIPQIDWLID